MKKLIIFFLLISFRLSYAFEDLVRLLIKIPTRSRPEQFMRRLDIYYEKLSGNVDITFIISCDTDDLSMNNQLMKDKLSKYPNLFVYFGTSNTKVQAYNADIEKHDFDILLVASDDMEPVVHGYDKIIVDLMHKSFPDFDGVLNFNDGHVGADLNTMPVIGKKYYDRFGYVYHHDYISEWCDNEFTAISKLLNKELVSDLIIRHIHYAWLEATKDALYIKNSKFWDVDKHTYYRRTSNNFFLILK